MLRVRVLGQLALELDGRPLATPVGRPGQALLGWLALHPGTHSRARVAAQLWPDVVDESARGSLRVALVDVRRALGQAADSSLLATRDHIGLAAPSAVSSDAQEFSELLDSGMLEQALGLWRGELLEGLEAGDWLVALRDQYRDRRADAIAALADAAELAGDREGALRHARERVALDPLAEAPVRYLMRQLADSGDRAAALVAYERLAERLRTELRIAPSAPTRALEDALRGGERVAAAQTGAERQTEGQVPAGLATVGARSTFVGREAELARLIEVTRSRQRHLVAVAGEPGAGKTRLASELAHSAVAEGTSVLFGRCDEDPLVAYQPFVEALREHVGRVGASAVASLAGDELSMLLPELRIAQPLHPDAQAAGAARLRLFEGVLATLDAAARERPLVLVLDDLHWADRSTVRLLAHVVRAPTPAALTVVTAYRPSDLGSNHPLPAALAELDRERRVHRLELGRLDADAVSAILADTLEIQPAAELVAHVERETAGNPFFVEEVARHLLESDALVLRDRHATLRAPDAAASVPASVRGIVRSRVERLGETAADALALAAVAGPELSLPLLERTGQIERETLLDALQSAEAAKLISPVPGRAQQWTFTHSLVRAALYETLPTVRRARLHSRIADVLEASGSAEPAELAHHTFEAITVDGPQRAAHAARSAGDHATASLAYEEATAHYTRALHALELGEAPPAHERCELLLALGGAQARSADPQAPGTFATAAEAARELGDAELLGRAALGHCGVGVSIIGVDDERAALLEEALARLGECAPGLRAQLLARLAIERYYAPSRQHSGPVSDQAVQIARTADDPDALLAALNARHVALWTPDGLRERLSVAEEMITLARDHARPEQELQGHNWLCTDLWEAGELEQFTAAASEHARLARMLRLPAFRWYEPLWHGAVAALHGEWAEAERHIDEAEAAGTQAGDRNAAVSVFGMRLSIRCARHEFRAEDLEAIEQTVQRSPASSAWRCMRCWYLAEHGRLKQASADLDWLAADHFTRLPRDANWLPALFELSEATWLLSDARRAQQLYEMVLPYRDRHISAMRGCVSWGSAESTLGVLAHTAGRSDEAAGHYEAALAAEQRWHARAWLVRTKSHYALLLKHRPNPDDHHRARELAREAATQATRLGLDETAVPSDVRTLAA